MAFYVYSSDGQRYGPADLETLVKWAQEGRVLPDQLIEDDVTGSRAPARQMPGLLFPTSFGPGHSAQQPGTYVPPGATPFGGSPTGLPGGQFYADDGLGDVRTAWVFGALAIIPCCIGLVFAALGVSSANRAISKGNPGGSAAKTFCLVMLVVSILSTLGVISIRL